MPAWRRYEVTRVSFPQLAWCLDQLRVRHGIEGRCVVIGDDDNIDYAREHHFATIKAPNQPLGRKWNHGYQHAAEHGADYFVPCGTDDWLDPDYLVLLPRANEVRASRWATAVSEDGSELIHFNINYTGGDGIRIIPRTLLERCSFRPAEETRERAIDTSVFRTLSRNATFRFVYADDPLNIVQFQSHEPQLNPYENLKKRFPCRVKADPLAVLAERYEPRFVELARRMIEQRNG